MSQGYFVTGTDTDCGKTVISCALMANAARQGQSVVGMKPVAAGAVDTVDGLRNDDALAIQKYCTIKTPYELINPVCYAQPVAPHLQNTATGDTQGNSVISAFKKLATTADTVIVEGVGGWRVPLSDNTDVADLCLRMQLPVILVVGMRLGCINHALLTVESIHNSGAMLAGWVANQVDSQMDAVAENISSLQSRIDAPLLGHVPYLNETTAELVGQYITG